MTDRLDAVLEIRELHYGAYSKFCANVQAFKKVISRGIDASHHEFTDAQKETLDMIAHKIARIITGDPNYIDSWLDIAGYAQKQVQELEKE